VEPLLALRLELLMAQHDQRASALTAADKAHLGLARIVTLHYHSSALYRVH
jgi:hypothetical protein